MWLTNRNSGIAPSQTSTALTQVLQLAICLQASFAIGVGCRTKQETNSEQVSEGLTALPSATDIFERQVTEIRNQKSTTIRLTQQSVDASQLERLRDLHQLEELVLDQGVVTDSSFQYLIGLNSLNHLRLRNSLLTDDAIATLSVSNFASLRVLNLPQSAFSATGLERLKSLPNLIQLRLGGSKIDDRACQILSQFPKLQSLHLIGPQLSDLGLQHLANASELATLYIDDCKLSDSAWELLLKVKPNLHVHIDQQHQDRGTESSK